MSYIKLLRCDGCQKEVTVTEKGELIQHLRMLYPEWLIGVDNQDISVSALGVPVLCPSCKTPPMPDIDRLEKKMDMVVERLDAIIGRIG